MSRGFGSAQRIGWAGWGREAANHQLRARERAAGSEPSLPPPGQAAAGTGGTAVRTGQPHRPLGGRPRTMSRPSSRSSCRAVRAARR